MSTTSSGTVIIGGQNKLSMTMVAISLIRKDGGTGPNDGCCLNNLETHGCTLLPVNWALSDTVFLN